MAEDRSGAAADLALATVVARLHAALQSATEELTSTGLTADQWRVLDHLVRRGPTAMSALAGAVALTGPTATRVADALTQAALAYRAIDSVDRRRTLLHASKRGARLHARLAPAVAERHREVLATAIDRFSPEDREALAAAVAGRRVEV